MQTNMSENVRRLRAIKGITQEQLAEAIGITQGMVMRIENGSKMPGVATVIAIADFFQCSIDALLRGNCA